MALHSVSRRGRFRRLALLVLGSLLGANSTILYGINVSAVYCLGSYTSIEIAEPSESVVIPFFLRTTGREATITYGMYSPEGSYSIAQHSVTLPSWSRRLQEWLHSPMNALRRLSGARPKAWKLRPSANITLHDAPVRAAAPTPAPEMRSGATQQPEAFESPCEEFFLLDGRSPVDLPDTWGEARSSFLGICMDAGDDADKCEIALESTFGDSASADADALFRPGPELCDSMMAWAAKNYEVVALKPRRLKSSGSGGGYYTSSGTSAANGWSASSGKSYGWSTTSLSSRYSSSRTTSIGYSGRVHAAVLTSYTVRRHSSYYSSHHDSECTTTDCDFQAGDNETMYGDDMFDYILTTSSYSWPQVLELSSISGSFVEDVQVCPEVEAGESAGLYFGLATPEELEWEDDESVWVLVAQIAGGIIGCCFLLSGMYCVCKKCGILDLCSDLCRSSGGGSSSRSSYANAEVVRPEATENAPQQQAIENEAPRASGNEVVYGSPTYVTATVVQGVPAPTNECSKTE